MPLCGIAGPGKESCGCPSKPEGERDAFASVFHLTALFTGAPGFHFLLSPAECTDSPALWEKGQNWDRGVSSYSSVVRLRGLMMQRGSTLRPKSQITASGLADEVFLSQSNAFQLEST